MNNSQPTHPGDIDLLAYLDGAAGDDVGAHVSQCTTCQKRMQDLASFQQQLTGTLYRADCPSPLELGEYNLELLPEERMRAVHLHVQSCPQCSREMAQLDAFLAELAPDIEHSLVEQVAARVRVVIARLVSGLEGSGGLGRPALAPAVAGLRGAETPVLVYEADGLQITLRSEPDPGAPGRLVLLGLVMGAEGEGWRAHLWRGEQRVGTVAVDEWGNLAFAGLEPGRYQVVLEGPGVEIHLPELDAKQP
jgi:hypothetical protein